MVLHKDDWIFLNFLVREREREREREILGGQPEGLEASQSVVKASQ